MGACIRLKIEQYSNTYTHAYIIYMLITYIHIQLFHTHFCTRIKLLQTFNLIKGNQGFFAYIGKHLHWTNYITYILNILI